MKIQSRPLRFPQLSAAILFAASACNIVAGEPAIETRVFKNNEKMTMPYRILKPAGYDKKKRYPLVLCLHGAGGRGHDNRSLGSEAFSVLSSPKIRSKYPAFLLTPQCPKNKQWVNTPWKNGSYSISNVSISEEMKLVVGVLNSVEAEFSIDPDRLYVTGQSMGGYGTWDIILRYPKRFAAAVPVCGAGDPGKAKSIAHLPVWAFHGDNDAVVPTKGSREIVKALQDNGSTIHYTEYKGVGHNSWSPAWKEKSLIPWIFKQHR